MNVGMKDPEAVEELRVNQEIRGDFEEMRGEFGNLLRIGKVMNLISVYL